MHYFIMNNQNKEELQQISFSHSSNNDYKEFMSYKGCTAKSYTFLVNDATLASDNPLCLRKNLLERL